MNPEEIIKKLEIEINQAEHNRRFAQNKADPPMEDDKDVRYFQGKIYGLLLSINYIKEKKKPEIIKTLKELAFLALEEHSEFKSCTCPMCKKAIEAKHIIERI